MSNTGNTSPKKPVIPEKIRSSLVLKLNLKMAGLLIAAFFLMNILISVLYFSTALWRAESGGEDYLNHFQQELSSLATEEISIGAYRLRHLDTVPEGIPFLRDFSHRLPLPLDASRRSFSMDDDSGSNSLTTENAASEGSRRWRNIRYDVTLPAEDGFYQLSYRMEEDFQIYFFILGVLILIQLLYLLISLKNNRKSVRRVLKPLSELAETTNKLRAGLDSTGRISDHKDLEKLARLISGFDANQMENGIPVDQTQNELKDLAGAINEMLHRINQSYEAQVRFVSDASHELRTPIAVIRGYADLLDRWGKENPKTLQESIDAIKNETENMQNLVEQLLFLARGDSKHMSLSFEIMDLSGVGESVIREAKLIDSKHSFRIDAAEKVYFNGDPKLIKQAIRILVDNSIKYSPEGEEIFIRIYSKDEKAYIQVQDHGDGMQPEEVPRIFDRFYRSADARGSTESGAGLGLSIAKWIVETHQGALEVLSRQGIGTRVTIELPATQKHSKNSGTNREDSGTDLLSSRH